MKLNIIGNRGAFSIKNEGTSCYLIEEENTKICLDFGSSALANVQNKAEISQIDAIVLTHLHFDHIADIFTLSYLLGLKKVNKKLDIILPNDNSVVYNLLKNIPEFNLIDIEENREYFVKDLKLEFFEMKHKVVTFGVKVFSQDKVLSYTGDTIQNDNLPKLLNGSNVALCDACVLDKNYKDGSPHISVLEIAKACKNANVDKMLLTHFTIDDKAELLKEAKQEFENSILTEIGKEYSVW